MCCVSHASELAAVRRPQLAPLNKKGRTLMTTGFAPPRSKQTRIAVHPSHRDAIRDVNLLKFKISLSWLCNLDVAFMQLSYGYYVGKPNALHI